MGVLSRGRISVCADKRHSEQSRAGVTDECFSVAAVGLEHLKRLVPRDIRDLDQVRAALAAVLNKHGSTLNFTMRHELGHCNGWPGDHPVAR